LSRSSPTTPIPMGDKQKAWEGGQQLCGAGIGALLGIGSTRLLLSSARVMGLTHPRVCWRLCPGLIGSKDRTRRYCGTCQGSNLEKWPGYPGPFPPALYSLARDTHHPGRNLQLTPIIPMLSQPWA
jgi:hypothetical protein